MVLRRVARIVVLAFIAGPALNLDCLISCSTPIALRRSEQCHRTHDQRTTIAADAGCGDVQAHLSPYVKSSTGLVSFVFAPSSGRAVGEIRAGAQQTSVSRAPNTGPPDVLAVIPLRI